MTDRTENYHRPLCRNVNGKGIKIHPCNRSSHDWMSNHPCSNTRFTYMGTYWMPNHPCSNTRFTYMGTYWMPNHPCSNTRFTYKGTYWIPNHPCSNTRFTYKGTYWMPNHPCSNTRFTYKGTHCNVLCWQIGMSMTELVWDRIETELVWDRIETELVWVWSLHSFADVFRKDYASLIRSNHSYSHWNISKSLMAEWLQQASQWHELYCHDLEVMSSKVKLGVHSTFVQI